MKLIDIILAWISGANFISAIFAAILGNWLFFFICAFFSVACIIAIGPTKKGQS